MGASFLYSVVPKFKVTEERKQRLEQALAALSDKELLEDLPFPFQPADDADPEEIRHEVIDAVLVTQEVDSEIWLPGMRWRGLIDGGMSWGDSPTDRFDSFLIANHYNVVMDAMTEMATEDFAKEGQHDSSGQ
jgi:hypothetical protein